MPFLQIEAVTRSFGGKRAVDAVSFDLETGKITALVGENGAGKTTLMRICSGALGPDRGGIVIDGRQVTFRSPAEASAAGIEMVHQHSLLVPELTVAENLALSSLDSPFLLSSRAIRAVATRMIDRSGVGLGSLDRRIDEVAVGEKSRIELVRALARSPRLLILDEPTAVLTPGETVELFVLLRGCAARGMGVVLITHKLREVFELASEVAVLRTGSLVFRSKVAETSREAVAEAMVPRLTRLNTTEQRAHEESGGEIVLELREVSTKTGRHRTHLSQASLTVRRGELIAIIGVAGNGQEELTELLRGLIEASEGRVLVHGRTARSDELLRAALAHVPADRSRDGGVAELSIAENLSLAAGSWNRARAEARADKVIAGYNVAAESPRQSLGELSGGNQQKVILARELEKRPDVLVASEPTRGLDFASAGFIRARLAETARSGSAVLLVTSDLEEAFDLAGSIHVMFRGRLSPRLDVETARLRAGTLMAGLE